MLQCTKWSKYLDLSTSKLTCFYIYVHRIRTSIIRDFFTKNILHMRFGAVLKIPYLYVVQGDITSCQKLLKILNPLAIILNKIHWSAPYIKRNVSLDSSFLEPFKMGWLITCCVVTKGWFSICTLRYVTQLTAVNNIDEPR